MPFERLPAHLVQAFIAGEDADFYEHRGVDAGALLRAVQANLRGGRIVQGGSTITQQLAKTLFLGPERTFWRKAREAMRSRYRSSSASRSTRSSRST